MKKDFLKKNYFVIGICAIAIIAIVYFAMQGAGTSTGKFIRSPTGIYTGQTNNSYKAESFILTDKTGNEIGKLTLGPNDGLVMKKTKANAYTLYLANGGLNIDGHTLSLTNKGAPANSQTWGFVVSTADGRLIWENNQMTLNMVS